MLGVITSFFATLSESKLTSIDEKPYTRPQKPHETTTRSISSSTSTLQLVIITHRHGDRTPIYYPSDELDFVTWPLGYGQLTPLGVHQLFELGFAVRNNLPYDFLPANYSSELVHIRASDTDRTLQSAESLMVPSFCYLYFLLFITTKIIFILVLLNTRVNKYIIK